MLNSAKIIPADRRKCAISEQICGGRGSPGSATDLEKQLHQSKQKLLLIWDSTVLYACLNKRCNDLILLGSYCFFKSKGFQPFSLFVESQFLCNSVVSR